MAPFITKGLRRALQISDDRTVFAVGDLHGRFDLLRAALDFIASDLQGHNLRLVFLGDYIDRGPHSRDVIQTLRRGPEDPRQEWVILMGNHEQMFIDAMSGDPKEIDRWLDNGGTATLRSYDLDIADLTTPRATALRGDAEWLSSLPLLLEDASRIYVHAGIHPGMPIEAQDWRQFLWIREPFLYGKHTLNKLIVHGHTPTDGEPDLRLPFRLNLDTGAYMTGRLAIAKFIPGKLRPKLHVVSA